MFESVIRVLMELKLPLGNQKSSGYFQSEGTHTFDSWMLVRGLQFAYASTSQARLNRDSVAYMMDDNASIY